MKGNALTLTVLTVITVALATALDTRRHDVLRPRRSLSSVPIIGSLLFGGEKETKIPHLGQYPLWKVHRYHGISLQPVSIPSDRIPSNLPISPNLSGEAPSIVNVPNPNYAPPDAIVAPPNQYSAPYPPAEQRPSAPYPPAEPYSAPYPAAEQRPSAPYPPADPPSAPYPPAVPSGPYPPPSAPHPPIYNAQQHSGASASSASAAAEFATPAEFAETAQAGGEGSSGSFFDLQSMLPPELYNRLQQYTSTAQGREKVGALLRIAANAQKLKTNAASTLQGVFEKFFGGAGGSANIAYESGTYTNIPKVYPQPQGIFNGFKPVGTGVSGSPLPILPEVPPLPEIPGLQKLPAAPGLPHINLPEISAAHKGSSGQYVSFRFPQAQSLPTSYEAPAPSIPSTSYGTPIGPTFRPSPQSSGGDFSTSFSGPQNSYGSPVSESSGGSISTFFQRPESSYGLSSFDSNSAASEIDEEFQPRNKQPQEVNQSSSSLQKTTKLHRVLSSQPFQSEDMRKYLDSEHPASQKEYQGFQPMEQKDNGESE